MFRTLLLVTALLILTGCKSNEKKARKYYEVRPAGLRALAEAVKRYRHLANLIPASAESVPTEA